MYIYMYIYRERERYVRNNITRSFSIFGINEIGVSYYLLLFNISSLHSKSHF